MSAGRLFGLKPGNAFVKFAHNLIAVHDLPGGKLRLARGKRLKPTNGCKGWNVVHCT